MNIKHLFNEQKIFFNQDTTIPINFRILHLTKLKKCLLEHEYEIYDALNKDLGKSKEDSFVSEFSYCIKEINFFIKKTNKFSKPKRIKTSFINFKSRGYIYRKPYGVCLIISCWNYPLLLSLTPLIGALSAGNTCMLKLHPFTPNTNKIIEKIIRNVFEKCYVSAISGDECTLDELFELNFDYIFATGSPNLGKYIYKKSSEKLTPMTLELGGKNPCIVHIDSNLDIASRRIAHGKFLNAGQTCLAPNTLYVNEKIKDEFVKKLKETINEMYSNDPMNFIHYSKIVNENNFNRLTKIIEDNKENIILGGESNSNTLKISPTLIDEGETIDEEIFGPILQIKSYKILDDLIHNFKNTDAPLAFYIFTNNKAIINKCLNIPFGGACINDTLVHVSEMNLPFGGLKNSGIGNYHGKSSFNTFTHEKSILIKSSKIDILSRYPNNKNYNLKFLKKIFTKK